MPVTVFMSAKGSPGTTTTALALTAATNIAPEGGVPTAPGLLIEADEAGGDLECWCGPYGEAGLVRAAVSARPNSIEELQEQGIAVEVVPGVPAVLAPTTAAAAAAVMGPVPNWLIEVGSLVGDVWVDAGRMDAVSLNRDLVAAASLVLLVCRSTLSSLEHTRELAAAVRKENRWVGLVVVGESGSYPADEIAQALSVPVVGELPWDPRGIGVLVERGASKAWRRSRIGVAAAEIAGSLTSLVQPDAGDRRG